MDFVTKKEYEAAVLVLKKALKNKQLLCGYNQALITKMVFGVDDEYDNGVGLEKVQFLPPFMAAQTALHELRQEMKKQKESVDNNKKVLDDLESKEKQLQGILPALKE